MIKPLFQRVIVAVNGSESSIHAAMYGILMAKVYHCHLKVVYVVDTATIKQLTASKFLVQDESYATEAGLTSDGDRNLTYVTNLAKAKGVKIDAELRKGAVWSEIVTAADEYKADVILLGGRTHKETATIIHDETSLENRSIIGSANCSVIVVKEPYIEQLYKLA
jgi:Universal stress protein UspA and related nucleotide-binding proteins